MVAASVFTITLLSFAGQPPVATITNAPTISNPHPLANNPVIFLGFPHFSITNGTKSYNLLGRSIPENIKKINHKRTHQTVHR